MITGIGTDLVRIGRIAGAMERFGDRFARRILADSELRDLPAAPDPARFIAKRFAVKEAAAKAFGRGMADGLSWKDFELVHDERGAPALQLAGRAAALAEQRGLLAAHVSLSDEEDYALAFVVLECR